MVKKHFVFGRPFAHISQRAVNITCLLFSLLSCSLSCRAVVYPDILSGASVCVCCIYSVKSLCYTFCCQYTAMHLPQHWLKKHFNIVSVCFQRLAGQDWGLNSGNVLRCGIRLMSAMSTFIPGHGHRFFVSLLRSVSLQMIHCFSISTKKSSNEQN